MQREIKREEEKERDPTMVEPIFDYQFRLILIGDSVVGKSSLLKFFTDGKFAEVCGNIHIYMYASPTHTHEMHVCHRVCVCVCVRFNIVIIIT